MLFFLKWLNLAEKVVTLGTYSAQVPPDPQIIGEGTVALLMGLE